MKPTVQYTGTPVLHPFFRDSYIINVLDHPRLGQLDGVTTSKVVIDINEEGDFETKNTFYVKAKE